MNRKQHKWAGFRAPKLRICTPDIIDHIVLHRRHSPPKTSSTDTIRSGRACQKPLLPASSPPKSDDQNSQKSFNNSQLGPGIPSMSTFCGQYSLEKNFLIVRSQVFRTFQISHPYQFSVHSMQNDQLLSFATQTVQKIFENPMKLILHSVKFVSFPMILFTKSRFSSQNSRFCQ